MVNAAASDRRSIASPEEQQTESPDSISVDHSRLIKDGRGRFMFIGDSANLSFLHNIRCVISDSQGPSPFVDDPFRSCMVEATPDDNAKSFDMTNDGQPPILCEAEAERFIRQFYVVTDGLLDLFDECEILTHLPLVLREPTSVSFLTRAIVYLVIAIGAQCTEADHSPTADAFFGSGRYLTAQYLMEDASIQTTQLYLLITVYLLCACRRNAAFICLGHATRSAYSLGVHRKSVSDLFPPQEKITRERLWTSIRAVDLFTSASLGRPPSTVETRPSNGTDRCSVPNDLYGILETILSDVYGNRKITTDMLAKIGSRQREWSAKFGQLGSLSKSFMSDASDPDLGSMHIKQTYYWTITLLTRPFLVDRVSAHAQKIKSSPSEQVQPCALVDPSKTLVHACVDSAIKTISLLEPILTMLEVPRHLPLLINAAFHSALILGFSYFGDLYQVFPLDRNLKTALEILLRFPNDSVAVRNAAIIQYLRHACEAYYERRQAASMTVESEAISHLFGQIHDLSTASASTDMYTCNSISDKQGTFSTLGYQDGPTVDAGVYDAAATSQGDGQSRQDILMRLFGGTDLDLNFPDTPQPTWLDAENDLTSLYAVIDMTDPSILSMGP